MKRFALPAMLLAVFVTPIHAGELKVLYRQPKTIHFVSDSVKGKVRAETAHVEVNQAEATALRIRGEVRANGVTGVPDGKTFAFVLNVNYEDTPPFWDTVIVPDTGTYPWRRVERYVRLRAPVKSLDVKFTFGRKLGEAWFRDFVVEEVPQWEEKHDLVVAQFGDSTTMTFYFPKCYTTSRRLELLLRDHFPDKSISVRMLGESGDFLKRVLNNGRLERELKTLTRCDIVTIRYGLNDVGHKTSPEDFKRLLAEMCDRILKRFPKAQIVLATTIPPAAEKHSEATRRLASERGYPLADIDKMLRGEAARGNWNWHAFAKGSEVGYLAGKNPPNNPTGLKGNKHPNPLGAQLIAEEMFRVIRPVAQKRLESAK